jgi:type I restriction enzyme, S subunit
LWIKEEGSIVRELPKGWAEVTLEDIAQWGSGGTPARKNPEYYDGEIPWIKTGELNQKFVLDTEEKISDLALKNSSAKIFPKGSVAVAMYGATIGKTSILGIDAATNQACAVGVPNTKVTIAEYLWHYLSSQKEEFIEAGKGGAQPNISQGVIKEWEIPLPPLNEQKRIADRLDLLLTRIDKTKAHLDRIPPLLKRFRQSVLAAATSGKLTEDWREANSLDIENWKDVTVGDLIDKIEAGINVQCEERPPLPHEYGLVKISAVTWGTYDDTKSKTIPVTHIVPESTRIAVGDFLISRANTLELVAACVIVEKVERPVFLSDKVLRVVMNEEYKQWLLFCLRSENGRNQIEKLASGNQLSMRNITQNSIKSIKLKLPSPEEQHEIVRRVETLFAKADRIEAQYQKARQDVDRLTPALLAKAFRGELVPQDPNDEPASVLLERVKAAKAQAPTKTKRQKKS